MTDTQMELILSTISTFAQRIGEGQVLTEDEAMYYHSCCRLVKLINYGNELSLRKQIKELEKELYDGDDDDDNGRPTRRPPPDADGEGGLPSDVQPSV